MTPGRVYPPGRNHRLRARRTVWPEDHTFLFARYLASLNFSCFTRAEMAAKSLPLKPLAPAQVKHAVALLVGVPLRRSLHKCNSVADLELMERLFREFINSPNAKDPPTKRQLFDAVTLEANLVKLNLTKID